ncbi:L-threonylcarbamoyladenylate synthase [Catalinimonas alkaloidigena]|uniref:Threonylcarbamoyl-AMP synthase n=1 Tax=Catalinimonas alkaloidigena TaxID=1075417 RepID=A0A1G9B1N0_9BACT|nr:L-threonylcarbamoyladenylate synthase [Catalinimonas alkaloidigena]SDK32820.1 L-threonylcarbamoyladenylate synthase [Catalinimonas alkaloidigena]
MIGTDVSQAAALLRQGQLVAIPTETVYGLAANALDVQAVSRIFEAKKRPSFDPLIVHIGALAQLETYVTQLPPLALRLAEHFWPGPLTLLLDRRPLIPDLVTAGLPQVGIRLPAHPLTQQLLATLDFPLAAPSANPFGYISPTTAQHVAQQLGEQVPYILDGGPCQVGLESTIVGFPEGRPLVYRLGGIALEQLEAVIGEPVERRAHSTSNPQAPGMLKSHYAPRIPFHVGEIDALLEKFPHQNVGVLSLQTTYPSVNAAWQVQLSPTGHLPEAAGRLFAAMRHLDSLPLDVIVAEWMPETGLGRAMNDRLRRAAVPDNLQTGEI